MNKVLGITDGDKNHGNRGGDQEGILQEGDASIANRSKQVYLDTKQDETVLMD